MLIVCAVGHDCTLSGLQTLGVILGVWVFLGGVAFIPWRRVFSVEFWTHPTIDAMQARMLREVWEEYRLRRVFPISYGALRHVQPFLVGDENRIFRLLDEPIFGFKSGGQSLTYWG